MILFRATLRQRILDILTPVIGTGSDPTEYIRTFDSLLRDFDTAQLPALVINVRTSEKLAPGEIGNPYQKHTWTVHLYYIDMELVAANYNVADLRRDHIMAKAEKALEAHSLLDMNGAGLSLVDADGHREYVYDSSVEATTFDSTGQDGYQTFTCEMYYEVYTDRL